MALPFSQLFSQTAYPSTPQTQVPVAGGSSLPTAPEPQNVPYRQTPPWGEPSAWDQQDIGILPGNAPAHYAAEDLHARQNIAFGNKALPLVWFNDPQFGWPPPGAPNVQDFQSGHTSVTIHNQSAEQGWGTDPAFKWMRYPHMENHAAAYSWGVARRFGEFLSPKAFTPLQSVIQQQRDMTLRHALMHRLHQVVVQAAPTVTNTMNAQPMVPFAVPADIGAEGVLPG